MTRLVNPIPIYLDARGELLDAGYIYIGVNGTDPQVSPISVFWDAGYTVAAAQPLRTLGGVIVNGGAPAFVFFPQTDYSLKINDANGNLVLYLPSTAASVVAYQPLNGDLSTISSQSNAVYGLSLLTLANQAALKAATGIPDCLPQSGGAVTGNITRQGAGVHTYHANYTYVSGRIFGPEYTTDPTSLPGDIWMASA